jgi:hypothetical protein
MLTKSKNVNTFDLVSNQNSFTKKEKPKEQALYQAYLSIKKLKKFGVEI